VLVPVKRFTAAKGRLTGVLVDSERSGLAQWMATRVLEVVAELPAFVACDDADVAAWAESKGARVIWGEGLGLNGAVDDGVAQIFAHGFDHVVVSHADLPRPHGLLRVARTGCITLVPDRRRDGTNVMSFPSSSPLLASYGGGSFSRHLAQALRMGTAEVEVRCDPDLSLDLDTERDLSHPLIRPLVHPLIAPLVASTSH
jgi:2-phospho-L-lactate/phosphoenolpyruvate guanylyltransferase